ncbi:MAG TPA: pentapeptide repeat-containing protein [Fulvivirga sp.]|nr:pentapeptide repeat-containing protein [Fulvivirga sp.]
MINPIFEDQLFKGIDYTLQPFPNGEYEQCTFINCNFSGVNLFNITFMDCEFENCNFSEAQLNNTGLKSVIFKNCKLIGLQFDRCNPFLLAMGFDNCQLNLSYFYKLKLKQTRFKNCNLQEADFTEADFTESIFDNCDLANAIFSKTVLVKADFRSSFNYSIDPESNRIKKAKFSRQGLSGLLDKYQIEIE